MIALPIGFLPFDPNRDYEESDVEDDESSSESDDDLHDSISNGDKKHERKQNRHIGGGVILVTKVSDFKKIFDILFNRAQQVNVFLLQC
jgi:hypothetical protein